MLEISSIHVYGVPLPIGGGRYAIRTKQGLIPVQCDVPRDREQLQTSAGRSKRVLVLGDLATIEGELVVYCHSVWFRP